MLSNSLVVANLSSAMFTAACQHKAHVHCCVLAWSLIGLVKDADILAVTQLPDVKDNVASDYEMDAGFDNINGSKASEIPCIFCSTFHSCLYK